MSEYTKEEHQRVASEMPRDEHGHFIHQEHATPASETPNTQPAQHVNPLTQFLHDETAIHKTNEDELVDIHVGNPLHRIQTLLEEIKRQKAFSFTLKGSLGIMGVVLVAGTFGILGGTKVLCDKGIQTKMGSLQTLTYMDPAEQTWFDYIPFVSNFLPHSKIKRTILITPDHQILHLMFNKEFSQTEDYGLRTDDFFVTGGYDSCSQTLTVSDPSGIQPSQ